MKQRVCLLTTLLFAIVGCVDSRSVGYVDRSNVPDGFVGKSYRAWLDGRTIFIEVDQIPGLNVVGIEHRIDAGAIYLQPRRASSGGGGTALLRVDLSAESLPPGWERRIYWLTLEYFYPPGNPGYSRPEARKPAERVQVRWVDN